MNKLKRMMLFIPLLSLTSCGFSLNYIVEGNKYNSPIFNDNYYQHWDSELKNAQEGINQELDSYITKFSELYTLDPNILLEGYTNADDYGADYKMNKVNDMFNYGYQSKLFDGQVQCLGYYQLARVQTDKDGFSMRFDKESDELDYFAMQFKATTDNTVETCYKVNSEELAQSDYDMFHNSTVKLHVSLYTKNDANAIVRNTFTTNIIFDNNSTNNGSRYVFLAFSLKDYHISRVNGISITYEFEDELINWNKTKGVNDITYSLMIYEMFMPYTTWH